jgi:glyoxylase I family protein
LSQIGGIFHFNVNCSDFERSRAFYEAVGFRLVLEFPAGEYPEVERGLGIGRHRVKGALFAIGEAPNPSLLDLLEWDGPRAPRGDKADLTAVGSPRFALWTPAFDTEVERLREVGIAFVNEPAEVVGPTGHTSRFVCFLDPDGHVVELVEFPPTP